jgi:16S rRNA (cytidine1402-2'-O)-methyltransferase
VIIVAGTPLGNAQDASPRLQELLESADVIAAEDTRRARRLIDTLGVQVKGRLFSYFEGNERERADELVEFARNGMTVLVLTDAGMPGISDPGYRVVHAAIRADVPLTCVPGPSAVPTALILSGLPTDRFTFEGFLPRKAGERRSRIGELAEQERTMVFFEAPHRLAATLAAMIDVFGPDRQAAVCREMTKTHEEVIRGSLAEISAWAQSGVLGETTVVVAGADADAVRRSRGLITESDWVDAVRARVRDGLDQRAAITEVASAAQVPRREVYEAVVKAKHEP